MNKKFLKLCLASILSLSINADLQAHEITPPIHAAQETVVAEDTLSKVEGFIQEVLKIYPTLEVKFSAQDGELVFSKPSPTSVQNIDLIFESLDNQEWIDSLKSFKMINVYFDPNSSLLTSILTKTNNLQFLTLNNTKLGSMAENEFTAFADTLSSKTKLQTLVLASNDLGGRLATLVPAIANITNLQTLSLAGNELGLMGKTALETFTSALSKLTKLQSLYLNGNDLQNGAAILAPAIANMSDLQTLSLSGNELGLMGETALETFTSALSKLTKLQALYLNSNNLGERLAILAPIIANMTDLQTLSLAGNELGLMGESNLTTFANALSKLTKLHSLSLESNNLQNGAAIIASAIANMSDLQTLGLIYNKLGLMDESNFNTFASALSKLTKLKMLCLGATELESMSTNGLITLASALSLLTKLETLDLSHNNLGERFAILASAITNMTDLQHLNLSYNKLELMDENGFNTFASALFQLTKLQILSLDNNNLGGRLAILAPAIANMTDLNGLSLGFNNLESMGPDDLNTLANALSKLTKLQTLGFEDNDFQNSATILAPAIANMTDLQSLGLACNKLGSMNETALNTFASALSKLTKLHSLYLGGTELGAMDKNGINTLASALSKLTKLQILDLSHNGLGKELAILAPVFANTTNLQSLRLDSNQLGSMEDDDLNTLVNVLPELTKLHSLYLSNNSFGAKFALLAPAIANSTDLQTLYLGGNRLELMDKDGFNTFANTLSKLTKLQTLDLEDNSFGEKFALLAPAIANLTDLQTLYLCLTEQIPPEGWQAFTTSLSYTTNLRYLGLFSDHIEASTLNAFIEAILQTESIAGIPNLTLYSDSPRLKATHDLIISFPFQDEAVHARIQDALSAFNPAINVTFD